MSPVEDPRRFRQPLGIRLIVRVRDPAVRLRRRGVRQLHPIAYRHQSIDQPVPVVGRLHDDPAHPLPVRAERFVDTRQISDQPSPVHHRAAVLDHHHHTVIGVQINPTVECSDRRASSALGVGSVSANRTGQRLD